jgi:DNA-directed RNA polymerase subunit RPC12/RpoP
MSHVPPPAPDAFLARCVRCGGTIDVMPASSSLRCPYCAHEQGLPPALHADLHRYGGTVARELSRADEAYARAAGWQQWSEQSQRAIPRLKLVIPLLSAVTLCGALAFPISQALGFPPAQVGAVLTPLLVVPSFLLFGYVLYVYSGPGVAAKRVAAGRVAVACPNCGAGGEMVPGTPGQVCGYCGSLRMASAPVMRRGIDAAELAHRRARLEEFRNERLGMVGLSRYDMSAYLPYLVGGSLLLPVGGGTIGFSVAMLSGSEPFNPAIFAMWALFLGIVFTLAFVFIYRRSRLAAFRSSVSDLGHQFTAYPLAGAMDVAEWLNRYWPASYQVAHLRQGHFFVAAAFDVFGYPALLNADFTSGQHYKPRLHLLLAAESRIASNVDAEARRRVNAALARCRQLGFTVSESEAGLLAVADPETLAIVRRSPASLHQVATVLTTMAGAARASGAGAPP